MTYRADTPVLSAAQAEELGRFMAQYEIHVAGLVVRDVFGDGREVVNDPLTRTVTQTASAGSMGAVGAAGAVAAGLALPVLSVPLLFGALVADTKAIHALNKRQTTPGAVSSVITFSLPDVSDKRRKWAEYLLSIYAHRHHWRLSGLHDPEQLAAGARAAGYPAPWGKGKSAHPQTPHGNPAHTSAPRKRSARGSRLARLSRWLEDLND
jgi:hypothetical protein